MKSNRQLKAEYKQKKHQAGVFQVLNTSSNKVLIDASADVHAKWNRHRTELRFGSHRHRDLQKDWNTAGEAAFTFSILSTLDLEDGVAVDIKKELEVLKGMIVDENDLSIEMMY